MINRQQLLKDLQTLLTRIEADLLERSESTEVPEVPAALHAEYEKAAKAERTAQNYEDWRTDTITQAAAAWVLSCVFVRFLEDNSLIDPPKIAGPGERLARARDEYELYFREHLKQTDRDYLLSIFAQLAKLPGTSDIFGEHNAINDLPNWLSGDAAGELLNFFQKIDASTGDLVHDFTDPQWDTRFLGDLYQDLSEAARKKFALLQTPDFVEEFILDRTLEPALDEFGLVPGESGSPRPASGRGAGGEGQGVFKMIDPACGSGHFLLGAFPRLLNRWQRKEPGTNIRELTQRALDSIHGVDINPFAVAIAKFRLLLVAMKSCEIRRLAHAPAFQINAACGDSLLHGENRTSTGQNLMDFAECATDQELYSHTYPGEDLQIVRALLRPGTYHCVVANPPYITVKDRSLNTRYRARYASCSGKYSLAVPFMERLFSLALRGDDTAMQQGGFVGQITSNSFMKRPYAKKLIEVFIPRWDMTHIVDCAGAYIPGHNRDGTPTVILFGKNQPPVSDTVRTVLGILSEPKTPANPVQGLVWQAIVRQIDEPGSESKWVTVASTPREKYHKFPWLVGGGGVANVKEALDEGGESTLGKCVDQLRGKPNIGITSFTLEDDMYIQPRTVLQRHGISLQYRVPMVDGDNVRHWSVADSDEVVLPYDENFEVIAIDEKLPIFRFLWVGKTVLANSKMFGKQTKVESGLKWFEFGRLTAHKLRRPISITFSDVSTHNNFAFNCRRRVFNRHAPLVVLRPGVGEQAHFQLLGTLNSSAACFWMKQVCFPKDGSAREWHERFEFAATLIAKLPIPAHQPTQASAALVRSNTEVRTWSPFTTLSKWTANERGELRALLDSARERTLGIQQLQIAWQEELDWQIYKAFGLLDEADSSGIVGVMLAEGEQMERVAELGLELGQRAFEIVLARKVAAGEIQTTWFSRHGSQPITDLPVEWDDDYRELVQRRISLIESDPNIQLIEQPEYKRRWNIESWESQLERALREWLLLRLEAYFDFDGRMTDEGREGSKPNSTSNAVPLREIAMYSVAQLADAARRDPQFMEVGELYRDDPAFDVQALVEELVLADSVPHLPILRYKDSGLRKRAEWEKTWDLQRREDAGEAVGTIPVPPKYTSADFISTGGARYWSLRGKLDVPKERWISFPHCEGPDGTLVICWAGYDHLQQAQAISAYYVRVQTEFGGSDDPRLIPLLASLIELLPWLKQWHNEPNANFDGLRMGDYFEGFVNEEARNLGKTLAEIKAWVPPKKVAKAAKPKKTKKGAAKTSLEGDE